mmetsp:Transcript_18655/g.40585  ORF Transcript_18655/g.40585 Transcript_18655/m.40585 type:complete len:88 (+) Transcript_18655:151-414(+)
MKKFTPEESPCIAIFYFICLEMAWFLPIDNIMEKDIFVFHNTTTLLHKRHVLQIHTHTHTHTHTHLLPFTEKWKFPGCRNLIWVHSL